MTGGNNNLMGFLSGSKLIAPFYALFIILFFFSPDLLAVQKDAIISLSTNKIVLGRDESIKVTVKLRKTASDFSLMAAYGKIENITRSDNGTIEATYYPPKRFYPGVDIIAAGIEYENTPEIKWVCAPVFLTGQGKATIKTEPGAETYIIIANDRFGPVTADSSGIALVDVMVPPFVNVGIDANGNIVDLNLPNSPNV
ncbi:MAG: hypothetical protein JXR91_17610, partial [Deltaproteobacteria bacterium]|nr:hypothetical protein [Deltaproteobacteria bacterium]